MKMLMTSFVGLWNIVDFIFCVKPRPVPYIDGSSSYFTTTTQTYLDLEAYRLQYNNEDIYKPKNRTVFYCHGFEIQINVWQQRLFPSTYCSSGGCTHRINFGKGGFSLP